jgi:hypothetical protein
MGRRLEELKATSSSAKTLDAPAAVEDAPRRVDAAGDDGVAALPLFDPLPVASPRAPTP